MKASHRYAATTLLLACPLLASALEETVCGEYRLWPEQTPAYARCFYAGAGIGVSRLEPDTGDSAWTNSDINDQAFTVYGGYRFARDWFVEGRLALLGEAGLKSSTPAATASVRYDALAVHAGYYLPVRFHWFDQPLPLKLFVKGGLSYVMKDASDSRVRLDSSGSLVLPALGGGLEWQLDQRWLLRAELDSFSSRTRMASLSAAYTFGGTRHYYEPAVEPPAAPAEALPACECSPAVDDSPTVEQLEQRNVEALQQNTLPAITLDVGSAELSQAARNELDALAKALQRFPDVSIEIHGHADSRGADSFNQLLSEQRANRVRDYLVERGIDAARLQTRGFGSSRPVADNSTEQGRQQNRRIEFVILNPAD